MQINKSDRNDAVGIARIMQCGWYKEVHVKDLDSHAVKALLVSRALLVKIKRDLENQVRGLLKNLGLVIGPAKMNVFALRAAELTEDRPELAAAVTPLLNARVAIEQQIADLDRKVMKLARNNAQVRHFMTAPGIGPVTALCFLATIDDPRRFRRSRSVGAYVGLTTRRFASGEIDWTVESRSAATKMLRSYLYEAANVLLTRVAKWSALKAWACETKRATQSRGCGARKLAVISIGCGSMVPNSNGHQRRLQSSIANYRISADHRREPRSLPGRWRWCIAPGFAMLKKASALHTLIHQRHPTPSCGGHAPTAERTMNPARMFLESLTRRPGIREQPWSKAPL